MNILILGGGGREHALGWAIGNSPGCDKLYVAPGNAGTAETGKNLNVDIKRFPAVKDAVLSYGIDFVVVGPEAPLAGGIVDYFKGDNQVKNIPVLGPPLKGALLEGSKAYAKSFMMRNGIPAGNFEVFSHNEAETAKNYLKEHAMPVVIKADGLAAGKGVVICKSHEEAINVLDDYFVGEKFGSAGKKVVIEEYLGGRELSVIALSDGKDYLLLPEAKDYKRVGENDTGRNTGGMGCISPVPFADDKFMNKVREEVVKPTFESLPKEVIPFKGFLYFGLIEIEGEPKVLEFNVRMGDPEAQVVLPRVKNDWLTLLYDAALGNLGNTKLEVDPQVAATVVMASGGYPGKYEKGKEISGLNNIDESMIFHAGTRADEQKVVTSGGRVLAVTSLGKDLKEALEKSYTSIDKISFDRVYYRKDIGKDMM